MPQGYQEEEFRTPSGGISFAERQASLTILQSMLIYNIEMILIGTKNAAKLLLPFLKKLIGTWRTTRENSATCWIDLPRH